MNNFYLNQDTIGEGALIIDEESRPLPLWITEQKAREALPEEREEIVRKDNSLLISLGISLSVVLLFLLIFTFWRLKKYKNR